MCKKQMMEALEKNEKVPFILFKVQDSSCETADSNGANTVYKLVLESNLEKTDVDVAAEMELGNLHELTVVSNFITSKYKNVEVEQINL